MLSSTKKNGFTLIEVMIFIAISGMLFIFGLANLINTQQKDQFNIALNSIKNQIQVYLNNAANGNYQLPSNYYCEAGGSNSRLTITTSNSPPSSACSFLGLGFYLTKNNGSSNDEIQIVPIFGYTLKQGQSINSSSTPFSTSLSDSLPISDIRLVNSYQIPSSISVDHVSYNENAVTPIQISVFLILTNFNQYSSSSLLNSGSQIAGIIPIRPVATSLSQAVSYINQITDSCGASVNNVACRISNNVIISNSNTPMNPQSGVTICLDNTSVNESAAITIGATNSSSNTNIYSQLFNRRGCA